MPAHRNGTNGRSFPTIADLEDVLDDEDKEPVRRVPINLTDHTKDRWTKIHGTAFGYNIVAGDDSVFIAEWRPNHEQDPATQGQRANQGAHSSVPFRSLWIFVTAGITGSLVIDVFKIPGIRQDYVPVALRLPGLQGAFFDGTNPFPGEIVEVSGTVQTARDWSLDFRRLQGVPFEMEDQSGQIGERLKASALTPGFSRDNSVVALGASAILLGNNVGVMIDDAGSNVEGSNVQGMAVALSANVFVFADQSGTVGIQASQTLSVYRKVEKDSSGMTPDFSIDASKGAVVAMEIAGANYYRITFTNGGSGQSLFEFAHKHYGGSVAGHPK